MGSVSRRIGRQNSWSRNKVKAARPPYGLYDFRDWSMGPSHPAVPTQVDWAPQDDSRDYHIDAVFGDDANEGTSESPLRTVEEAFRRMRGEDGQTRGVLVYDGKRSYFDVSSSFPDAMSYPAPKR